MNAPRIPVFEEADLRSGHASSDLRRCALETGIFYLRHAEHLKRLHELASAAALRFFGEADEAERRAVTDDDPTIRRGYSPLGAESTAQSTQRGRTTDYAVAFSMGTDRNLFPSAAFASAWTGYFGALRAIACDVGQAVLRTAISEEGALLPACDPVLRFRSFPEVPADRSSEAEPCRMSEHYDLSILTLIQQTPCRNGFVSLQARIGGTLIDLPHIDDTLIVMCGAVAPLLSGGRIAVPLHRVAAPPLALRAGSDRTSSVFFLRPTRDFRFSTALARACGLDVALPGASATFSEWMSGNYAEMRTRNS